MIKKISISNFHQYALNRAALNERLFKIKKSDPPPPHCVEILVILETVDHILFKCKAYVPIRNELKALCVASKLKFNIINLLNNELLQQLVEKLLLKIHN